MDTFNLQFSNEIINKIINFYNSTNELLLLCGFSGCSKSEILNKSLENLDENTLVFKHLCFKHTTIDDFLLNFYDSFRKFSLERKVSLKKSMGETFANKVSFYFKNIDKKCVIVVDNYELVSDNIEILNLLAHIASFENTKLVLVSTEKNIDFFIRQNLSNEIIEIQPNSYEDFCSKVNLEIIDADENTLKELYEVTQGHELYLRMLLRYAKTTGVSLFDFLEEFKKRKMEFGDFIISKVISLVPSAYFSFLKNLCVYNHAISIDFIRNYSLGDVSQIEYLEKNLLISKVDNEIILKKFFKQHFINTLSVQEKFKIYNRLIEIYEEELSKSPKDRLLRLSRESIRKQIEMFERNIPKIKNQTVIGQNNFSYISLAQGSSNPWFDKKETDRKKRFLEKKKEFSKEEKVNFISEEDQLMLKEFRRRKFESEAKKQQENKEFGFIENLKLAYEYERDYKYPQALELLAKLKPQAPDDIVKTDILEHLAHISEKLNNFEIALEYYTQMGSLCIINKEFEKYYEVILQMANLYKHLYRFQSAKEEYLKIINAKNPLKLSTKTSAYLGLGDIFESENNIEEALKYYTLAKELIPDDDVVQSCEVSFKTAVLYDDMQDFEHAIEFYQKNIETSQNSKENKYLSQSYVNLGLIYSYEGDFENAAKYLKLAYDKDLEQKNLTGVYFSARELSKLYEGDNIELAIEYLKEALNCAKEMQDGFKLAYAYLELGDLYYNFSQNDAALECYFEARQALGENILDENKEIIERRIKDMKIKMFEENFRKIEERYVQ